MPDDSESEPTAGVIRPFRASNGKIAISINDPSFTSWIVLAPSDARNLASEILRLLGDPVLDA